MGVYLDEQAELSGEEGGSDEDLDFGDEGDVLELELDNVGSDEHLRSQVAKAHAKGSVLPAGSLLKRSVPGGTGYFLGQVAQKFALTSNHRLLAWWLERRAKRVHRQKQRIDDDARELMLMKEMLLPDGDLHSDSTRQRKFRWRNVDYGSADVSRRDDSDSDADSDDGHFSDPEVKALHNRLDKERGEREAWLKQQREEKVKKENEESKAKFSDLRENLVEKSKTAAAEPFSFNLGSKSKKPGFIFSRSRKYIDDFKKRHANIKTEQTGPSSCRNLLFNPISREAADKQKSMMWEKLGK